MSVPFEFLVGETVFAVNVLGPLVRLELETWEAREPRMYVDIRRCSFTDGDGNSSSYDESFREAGALLELLDSEITEASAEKETLTLRFDNGCALQAFVGSRYDFKTSWLVSGADRSFSWKPGLVSGRGGKLESHTRALPGRSGVVEIPTGEIHDWDSFHDVFAKALGFPKFYGRNMNAFNDCLRYPDEETGMLNIVIAPGDVLTLHLVDGKSFRERCPELYEGICNSAAFVNWARMEQGLRPIIAVARDWN